jgi:hypothetical protein
MLRIFGKIQRIGIISEPVPRRDEPGLTELGEQFAHSKA